MDMWALGVILYTLFSGRMPFPVRDKVALRRNIRMGNVLFTAEIWQDVSSEAKNLIMRLLCVDTSYRISAHKALSHPWVSIVKR